MTPTDVRTELDRLVAERHQLWRARAKLRPSSRASKPCSPMLSSAWREQ